MKKVLLFLAGLAFFTSVGATETPRLMLWITDPIGMNIAKCHLPEPLVGAPSLPTAVPTLTEHDVIHWNPDNGRWTLRPGRFTRSEISQKLQDHCFVLAIDGKLISSGVVLSARSARLTGFPTLNVYSQSNAPDLQLTSGNHGCHSRVIHLDALDAVLGQRAKLNGQLKQGAAKDDPKR